MRQKRFLDGSIITTEARHGRDAPTATAAAASHAPQWRFGRRSAANATPGCPQRDLPCVPVSDWTGDRPGHCHSHHGDLSNYTSHLPNGVTQSQAMYQDRFGKLQEHLRQLALLFRKLRLLYERCVEMTADLQEGPAELVPYVGEELVNVRVEPCSPAVHQERKEVLEKVRQKNQEMKVIMDQMRNLLWDVNAMLTLRK
ncbi:mediator of RNA polymerase II transcription subunit 30-like isoform X2 [Dunckerocampus dactyliophorus]|uniref:mediator of RNA polymerase II transcription subunit 30-like isoform X2 n=1 Tax=Dunckerocampus dactyliophorus TaxID=161453 RepID=UPI002406C319|nr:mediator of RNA polymerase II transcription subunit 30-like isoform X2 [Dunckerocampus dactyliophorus]